MLRQRILTALVLAPLVIWGILRLPTAAFAAGAAVVFGLAAWEWSRLSGLRQPALRAAYAVIILWLMLTLYYPVVHVDGFVTILGVLAAAWWLLALRIVIRFPAGEQFWRRSDPARGVAGVLITVPAWAALVGIHHFAGPAYLLLFMLLVWGADVAAFFAGRRWGRNKLAPRVSPGKTVEGVVGALVAALFIAGGGVFWLGLSLGAGAALVGVALFTAGVSVLGDLTESLFKRVSEVKDSGALLPGHGGMFDRIDSITAAAPWYLLGLAVLGRLA